MTALDVSLASLESRLRELAEAPSDTKLRGHQGDGALVEIGFVDENGGLTEAGSAYYVARHVRNDDDASSDALGELLRSNAIATAFCGTLWGTGEIPVAGAVSLLKRLTANQDDRSAKRWLELMNRGKVIAYNRNAPKLRVAYNPEELVAPPEEAERERSQGHVVSPDTPFGNLLALRELLRASRGFVYWYEQHLDKKVLEVLYREVPKETVATIRLLAGPANVDADLTAEFKRWRSEMRGRREIDCEWRVLPRKEAQRHHDRLFFTEGIARNLPPLNLILAGSKGEILPSGIAVKEFDRLWEMGEDLLAWDVEAQK